MRDRAPALDRGTLATGVAGLLITALGVTANAVSGGLELPPPDAGGGELVEFVRAHETGLRWDVALRYVILFALFVPFVVGLKRHVQGGDEIARHLANIAALAAVWLVATGGTANTLEAVVVFDHERLAAEPGVARLLNLLIGSFFLLTLFPHAAVIGSLSEAGRRTGALPLWLCLLGFAQVAASLGAVLLLPESGGYVDSSIAGVLAGVGFIGSGLWYGAAGVVLVVAWVRSPIKEPQSQPVT